MQAGKLRHRLVLQDFIETQDSFGQAQQNWSDWATVWGAVEPLTGRENFDSGGSQLLAEATHRIRLRYREGISHRMRVSWRGRLFDIQHVANLDSRDREIYLLAKELPDG